MTLFKDWVDFVIWPEQPDRITTLAERIDMTSAIHPESCSYQPSSKAIIQRSMIDRENDPFEAMQINHSGDVTIWTKGKVWLTSTDGVVEKLSNIPRNPPDEE